MGTSHLCGTTLSQTAHPADGPAGPRRPGSSAAIRDASLVTLEHKAGRMAWLVRDLLELHRLEMGDDLPLIPANAVMIAEEALASVLGLTDERAIELVFEAAALPRVLAHP